MENHTDIETLLTKYFEGTAFSLYQEPPFLHFPSRLVPQEAGLYVKI